MRFAFILNPVANRNRAGKEMGAWKDQILKLWPTATICESARKGDVTALSLELASDHDVVVACGGDGTLNELLSGIRGSRSIGAIIPMGSGNDFAKALGMSLEPHIALNQLQTAVPGAIDVVDVSVEGQRSFFQNTLGIGFDGWSNRYASASSIKNSRLRYTMAALKAIMNHGKQSYEVTIDGEKMETDALMITLANGGIEGGSFHVAPQARPNDGVLDVLIVLPIPKISLLIHLPFLLLRRRPAFPFMIYKKCNRISIVSKESMAVHADGESFGIDVHHIEAQLAKSAVRMMIPVNSSLLR